MHNTYMSDFDFEELDKAVTGALGADDASSRPVSSASFEEKPREAVETSRTEAEPSTQEERPTAPAARRSAGRFMDVVHPSSDMRTKNTSFTPPTPASVQSPVSEKPAESQPDTSDEKQETDQGLGWAQPLESPFLPDAKVEKRPLGAFSLDAAASAQQDEFLLEAPDEPLLEAHAMPDPIDFAENGSALPSEKEDTGSERIEAEAPAEIEVETKEVIEVEAPEEVLETSEVKEPTSTLESQPLIFEEHEPVGPASITQQYTEQPSSAPSSGAIYDTENYHQPLAVAPKKHSGIWVALWIFLLIVLGAGAGVAFYLFVLPML